MCLGTPTVFGIGGGIIFLSSRMYMGLMILCTLKYCTYSRAIVPEPSVLEVEIAFEKTKI